MNRLIHNRCRGMSLVELMISMGLMSFIFASTAFMVFYTGRNSLVVREQARSQSNAGMATERITNTLRGASQFRPYTGDDMASTVTRVLFDMPDPAGGLRTGIVAFVPASSPNESDGIIKIFEDVDDYSPGTVKDDQAEWEYPYIQDFKVVFNSPSWITMLVSYSYRGFILSDTDADKDGVTDSRLAGEYMSDVIAKNHHPGESAHYAQTTNTLFQL